MKIIHNSKSCIGCKACQIACQDRHNFPAEITVLKISERNKKSDNGMLDISYVLSVCKQCKNPGCEAACRFGAITRTDGVVVINADKCLGCGKCAKACPFGAVYILSGAKRRAVKCDLCITTDNGRPSCAAACPLDCISVL